MDNILSEVNIHDTVRYIYENLDDFRFWSLENIWMAQFRYCETEVGLLASRILGQKPSAKVWITSEMAGQITPVCPNAYLVIPRPHEYCTKNPNVLFCGCKENHFLQCQMNSQTTCELRSMDLVIHQKARKLKGKKTQGTSSFVIGVSEGHVDFVDEEDLKVLLADLNALADRLNAVQGESVVGTYPVHLDHIEKAIALARSPYDQRPANTLLLRDKQSRLVKPASQVESPGWLGRMFPRPPGTRVAATEVQPLDIANVKEAAIGRFMLIVTESKSDPRVVARLINEPLCFFLDIDLNPGSKAYFRRCSAGDVQVSLPLRDESRRFTVEAQLRVQFAFEKSMGHIQSSRHLLRGLVADYPKVSTASTRPFFWPVSVRKSPHKAVKNGRTCANSD
ncbi:hypothetical protein BJY00DRAFT_9269 [Aspergillus carlsbadensis]|nr:hypothetical protein BJY00DRAFT_9269 [Aspergillus carlsbadensis]